MPLETEWLIYKQEVLEKGSPIEVEDESHLMLAFYAGAQVALGLIEQRGEDPEAIQNELNRFQEKLMKSILDLMNGS